MQGDLVGLEKQLTEIDWLLDSATTYPHTLFIGPYGSGKTTLAQYIAHRSDQQLVKVNTPSIGVRDLEKIFFSLPDNGILFMDEIHAASAQTEDWLLEPLESGTVSFRIANGGAMSIPYHNFTLIGATTKQGLISKPLLSRFKYTLTVPKYSSEQLAIIIENQFDFSGVDALLIAQCVSVPRQAINLARRVENLVNSSTVSTVAEAVEFLGFQNGLSPEEQEYLQICEGQSLKSIAAMMRLDKNAVESIEDRLIDLRLIHFDSKGRHRC